MKNNTIKGFNVRVYAVCIHNNKLLTLTEYFNGSLINKLPGGGLEFGEGPVACLKREFLEELNLEIDNITSFYIQENFVESFVKNNQQIILLYFKVAIKNIAALVIKDSNIKKINWIELTDDSHLSLPVDQQMFNYLKTQVN